MPLRRGNSRRTVSANIRELHSGKTYARTRRKFGASRANKQAIAIALKKAGLNRRVRRRKRGR